jgi:chromosome segregation ATPase
MSERLTFATAKWRTAHAEVERLRAELEGLKLQIADDDDQRLTFATEEWRTAEVELERLRAELEELKGQIEDDDDLQRRLDAPSQDTLSDESRHS